MGKRPQAALILVAVLAAGVLSGSAGAKGPAAAIEVSGPLLGHSRLVTEGDALVEFNPWGQEFLGARLDEAPATTDALTVTMFLDDAMGNRRPAYRFSYYPRPDGGLIYLPGLGDPDYDLNKTTILDGNGRWYQASPEWDVFYESLLRIQPPSTGSGGLK